MADLTATLTIITDELGAADPAAAVERLVRFLACAEGVFDRVDDSSGHIQEVFHDAADAVPDLAARMPDDDKVEITKRLIPLVIDDEYGLIEAVLHGTIPVLPSAHLADIDAGLATAAKESGPPKGDALRDGRRLGRRDRLIRARHLKAYDTVSKARASIGAYLNFYDTRRPHASLDRQTPDQAYLHRLPLSVAD